MLRMTSRKMMTILYGFILDEGIDTFLESGWRVSSLLKIKQTMTSKKENIRIFYAISKKLIASQLK